MNFKKIIKSIGLIAIGILVTPVKSFFDHKLPQGFECLNKNYCDINDTTLYLSGWNKESDLVDKVIPCFYNFKEAYISGNVSDTFFKSTRFVYLGTKCKDNQPIHHVTYKNRDFFTALYSDNWKTYKKNPGFYRCKSKDVADCCVIPVSNSGPN